MKKTFLLMCLAAGLLSCTKEMTPQEEAPAGVPMKFNVTVAETKADKTGWANNDVIYVFFKGLGGANKFLMLSYDEGPGKWNTISSLVDTDFSGLSEKILTAVYLPQSVYVTYEDGAFSISTDGADGRLYNFYLYETDKAYTVDGTTVNVTLALKKPDNFVQFHIEGIQETYATYTFGCPLVKPVACAGVSVDGAVIEKELQPGARLKGIPDADGGIFAGRLVSTGSASYVFTLADANQTYELHRIAKTLVPGMMCNFPPLTELSTTKWIKRDHETDDYVDLGLSVYWGKFNLGSKTMSGAGDYYAWGELQPYYSKLSPLTWKDGKSDGYKWSNYLYGDGSTFTKYNGSDHTVLQPEDDAAYAVLGGKFRMPTIEEWDELRNTGNCNWYWLENGVDTYEGVTVEASGWKVVSRKEGYVGKSIFLPVTYYFYGTNSPNPATNPYGHYWSSSLVDTEVGKAHATGFSGSLVYTVDHERFYGCAVRLVRDK